MTSRPHARRSPWRAVLVGLAGALTLTSVLGACSQQETRNASDDPTVATSTPVESETSEATETPEVTESPTTASATPTETASTEPTPDLTPLLLPARAVGGLNESWRWRQGETRTGEPAGGDIADCVRFSLAAIGASEVATRTYLPPADAADTRTGVVQAVAQMPDEETAVRVMQVLRSWHEMCQSRLNRGSDQPHRVSAAERIAAGDDAFEYLHSTPGATPDTTAFEDVAQVRVGARISLVVVRLDAQDYNYEPRRSPAALSVVAAAPRLG